MSYDKQLYEAYGYKLDEGDDKLAQVRRDFVKDRNLRTLQKLHAESYRKREPTAYPVDLLRTLYAKILKGLTGVSPSRLNSATHLRHWGTYDGKKVYVACGVRASSHNNQLFVRMAEDPTVNTDAPECTLRIQQSGPGSFVSGLYAFNQVLNRSMTRGAGQMPSPGSSLYYSASDILKLVNATYDSVAR